MFGNRALRKIFWSKMDEIRIQMCKLHNEELHDEKRVKLAENVARMGNRKVAYRQWWENLKERHNLEELVVDRRIIVKQEFKEQDGKAWTGFTCLTVKTTCGLL